ncbi:hypothetical protein AAHC03_09645 [Spirometra sp. Aus1]
MLLENAVQKRQWPQLDTLEHHCTLELHTKIDLLCIHHFCDPLEPNQKMVAWRIPVLAAIFLFPCLCVPVGKRPRAKQEALISAELEEYLNRIREHLENSTEFTDHLSEGLSQNRSDFQPNFGLLSEHVLEKLHELKAQTRRHLMQLLRINQTTGSSAFHLPKDLIEVLDVGHPERFSPEDVKKIFEAITERARAIDAEEELLLRENEVAEVLERWESMINKTDEEKAPLIHQFEEEKKKSKEHSEKIHQPGSREQEMETWEEEDEMDLESYTPELFFRRHDLNSDNFIDEEEVRAILLPQVKNMRPESKIDRERILFQMGQTVLKKMDKDGDRRISLQEHTDFANSKEAVFDEEWDVENDFDELGAEPSAADLKKLEEEVERMQAQQPDSDILKEFHERIDHLEEELKRNQA